MYYVYIIYSSVLHKKYIGRTDDLKLRLAKHNSGATQFTRAGKPWRLLYYESFVNKNDAIAEELFLKSGKGRERLKFFLKNTMDDIFRGEVA